MEELLIEFVKSHDFLYNKANRQYKNILLRDKKFQELSDELDVPVRKLKKRWRTLRDKFNREIRLGNEPSRTGKHKTWKWMKHLMFLKDTQTTNTSSPGTVCKDEIVSNSGGTFYISTLPDTGSSTSHLESTSTPGPQSSKTNVQDLFLNTEKVPTSARVNKQQRIENTDMEADSEISQLVDLVKNSTAKPKTAAQYFFEGLAKQIDDANLPPEKFVFIQIEILKIFNKLLYEKELNQM